MSVKSVTIERACVRVCVCVCVCENYRYSHASGFSKPAYSHFVCVCLSNVHNIRRVLV